MSLTSADWYAPRRGRHSVSAGFTLIELVLVVMVLGVLAGIAAPRYATAMTAVQLEAAAKQLAADLRRAQSLALAKATSVAVAINPATETYSSLSLPDPKRPAATLAENVAERERYLAEADQPPRQVLIDVNLLQVTLDETQRCGVNFEALGRAAGTPITLSSQGLTGMLPGAAGSNGLSGSSSLSGSAWSSGSPGFFVQASGGDLDLVIEALISTTDAKSLANPRLLCVNGQESRIQVGEEIGYTTTTTTVNTTTTGNVQFLPTGTILNVTPRITRDGRVLLRVEPEVSAGAINPTTNAPGKSIIQVQTNVLLHSGQGMIIGGLIQETDSTQIARVPVLSTIPYVSGLFQRRQIVKKRTELIVALVPHVLPYSPEVDCRNQEEVMRATKPLLTGPLDRFPRPYEPRLPDPHEDLKGYRPWPLGRKAKAKVCTATACDLPAGSTDPQQLNDILQPQLVEPGFADPDPVPAEPEVARQPTRPWFR